MAKKAIDFEKRRKIITGKEVVERNKKRLKEASHSCHFIAYLIKVDKKVTNSRRPSSKITSVKSRIT